MPSIILREGVLSCRRVASLTWAAEVLFRRLMSAADSHGRLSAHPQMIRVLCYPSQIDRVVDTEIVDWLNEICAAGLIQLYRVDGERYLEIRNFRQKIRAKGKCPSPAEGAPDEADAKSQARPVPSFKVVEQPADKTEDGAETQEVWLGRLSHLFPDRNVAGELASYKQWGKKKGRAVNRRGFEIWLRNATPTIQENGNNGTSFSRMKTKELVLL